MKQTLEITTEVGIFTITADVNETEENETAINNILLENVPVVYGDDNKIPIIYSKTNEFAQICLLEEINYEVSFVSEINDINPFHSLLKFNSSPLKLFDFEKTYKGNLQFSSYIGKTYLDVYMDDECLFKIPIEVRSRKIEYNSHYPLMIGDLSKYASGVIFELHSPLYQSFDLSDDYLKSPYEQFMILEYIFQEDHLPSIVEYLSRHLHSSLESYSEEVPIAFASNITPDDLIDAIIDSEELYDNKIPLRVNETKFKDTIDVAENRFYKYFLELIDNLIEDLTERTDDGYAHDKLKKYKREVDYYLSQKYFGEISKMEHVPLNSQVLQKKEGYRDILSYFLMLEFGFKLNWSEITNKFKGNEKKVYKLYEYWCYFELLQIFEELTLDKVNFEDIFMISEDSMSISLREGIIKSFNYENAKVDLLYNKEFTRNHPYYSYSVNLRPDYTIAIHIHNETYFIHFDAKYKMYLDSESFKNQDIVKMHAYKDALKNTIGAYVLYPGSNDRIFYEKDETNSSVGAFGLNPGSNNHENISIFIKDMIEKIISQY